MPRDLRLETAQKGSDCDGVGGSQSPAEVIKAQKIIFVGYAGILELVSKCTILKYCKPFLKGLREN